MKRQMRIGLLFSAVLHAAGFTAFIFHRAPLAPLKQSPKPIEVTVMRGLPGLNHPSRRGSPRSIQKEKSVDVKKLFALTTSGSRPAPLGNTVNEVSTDVEAQIGSEGDGGLRGLEAWGESVSNPFWPHLAQQLHGRLKFLSNLYDLHSVGKVYVSLKFKADGSLDPQTVRSQSDMKYLQVYVLREICAEFCAPNMEVAKLIQKQNPGTVRLKISFVAGQRFDYARDPHPRMKPHTLDVERRLRVSSVQVGAANLFGSGSSDGSSSFNIGIPIEIESLFSSSHRKRYGWSGAKAHDESKRMMKKNLDRLYDDYKKLGWI